VRELQRCLMLLVVCLAVACGGSGSGSGNGSTATTGGIDSIGLQGADIPSGLTRCSNSGDVSKSTDQNVTGEWQFQQKAGAIAGYMTVYAGSSGDCTSFILATNGAKGKVLGSIVVQYKDEASAKAAYDGGIFGANASDINSKMLAAQGTTTGLGANSTYAFAAPFGVAVWADKTYVLAVVADNLGEADLKKASTNINGRIH